MASDSRLSSGNRLARLALLLIGLRACTSDSSTTIWDADNPPESCSAAELSAHDGGPWACREDDCPAALVTCDMLTEYCESTFADVWEEPPIGLAATQIAEQCRKTCGRRGFNASTIDAAIDLRYVHGLITQEEAAMLISFCDANPQRWTQSLTRARQADRDVKEAQAGRSSESCMLLFSQVRPAAIISSLPAALSSLPAATSPHFPPCLAPTPGSARQPFPALLPRLALRASLPALLAGLRVRQATSRAVHPPQTHNEALITHHRFHKLLAVAPRLATRLCSSP